MYVRQLELVDFRSYPRVVRRPRAGPERAGRAERRRQDQPGRGARATSRRCRRTGSRPTRRWSGSARSAAVVRVRDRRTTDASCWSSCRSSRARPTGPGSAGHRRPGRATCSARCGWCCSRPRISPWCAATRPSRRRYLDDLLVARQPRFAAVRADYERVLKQRNALLRTAYLARQGRRPRRRPVHIGRLGRAPGRHGAQLLAAPAGADRGARAATWHKAYDAVSAGRGEAARCDVRVEDAPPATTWRRRSPRRLREARPAEVERGVTLVGPHRDDLSLLLGDLPAKGYASHGESWSFALALRLAAYDLLRAEGDRAGARARRRVRRARRRPAGTAGRAGRRRRARCW